MLQLSQRPLLATDVDTSLFVDREQELGKLRRAIDLGLNSLVLGDAGTGKTSLVHQLERGLTSDQVPTRYVDASSAFDLNELSVAIGEPVLGLQRGAPPDRPAEGRTVVIVDGAAPSAIHGLFGRLRDEVWQLPFTWVVTGDSARRNAYLEPPADAFFDVVLELGDLSRRAVEELLRRRAAAAGRRDEAAAVLGKLAPAIAERATPRTPRQLLAAARDVLVADDPAAAVASVQDAQTRAAAFGRPHAMLFAELATLGPVSASDPELLDRLGWTRSRAVQVLRELEGEGLVTATLDRSGSGPGRPRKLYAVNREADR